MARFVRMCAWHEPRQAVLPGFTAGHGICQVCAAFVFAELKESPMGKHNIEWVRLMKDGGWQERPSNGYWPVIYRDVTSNGDLVRQEIRHENLSWNLYQHNQICGSGDLTEMLELAETCPVFI